MWAKIELFLEQTFSLTPRQQPIETKLIAIQINCANHESKTHAPRYLSREFEFELKAKYWSIRSAVKWYVSLSIELCLFFCLLAFGVGWLERIGAALGVAALLATLDEPTIQIGSNKF